MRKRSCVFVLIGITALFAASLAAAKGKPGPLTGIWDCQAHGPRGDLDFTLVLQQNKQTVTGTAASPIGDAQISSGTFKNKLLEIRLETSQVNYSLTAKFDKGKLSGTWSSDNDKGTWEGKKQAAPSK